MLLALLAIPFFSQAALEVALVINNEIVVSQWELALDESEYPKSVELPTDEGVIRFEISSVSIDTDEVEVQLKVFVTEENQEVLISAPVVRSKWNESEKLSLSDEPEKEVAFVFTPKKD